MGHVDGIGIEVGIGIFNPQPDNEIRKNISKKALIKSETRIKKFTI